MSKTYALTVKVAGTDEFLASADGNIDVIAYVARKLELQEGQTYSVEFTETEGIGTEVDTRTVLTLTADGETVSDLIASKVRKERKAEKTTDESAEVQNVEASREPALV